MSDERTELRERAVFPVLIPVLAILVTEAVVFSLSRVLLATGGTQAVAIALGTALVILMGAAVIASSPKMTSSAVIGLLAVVLLGVIVAGAVAYAHGPVYPKEKGGTKAEALVVSAQNVAFSVKALDLPAHGAVIDFRNQDTQPHNIAIFPSSAALTRALFRGAIVSPGQKASYEVGDLKPGSYYFHCDVHPTQMTGTVVVK
jgi:plastocyanin